jgi:cytoskeleton protein RodZ
MMERDQSGMEQMPEEGAAPSEAVALAGVGAALREAREQCGMGIGDVANRLKFSPRQIEALEQGNLAQLPELAFIRGFVRSYARLLHLDEEALLAALPGAAAPTPAAEKKAIAQPFPGAYAARRTNLLWLGAALVVALVIGIINWPSGRNQPESGSATDTAGMPPAASEVAGVSAASGVSAVSGVSAAPMSSAREAGESGPEVAAKPAPAKPKPAVTPIRAGQANAASAVPASVKPAAQATLRLVFDEDSWAEVKDENGAVLLSQICQAGSEQRVTSALPLSVVIGNAKGVKVYYKGQPIDLAPHTNVDVAHLKLR